MCAVYCVLCPVSCVLCTVCCVLCTIYVLYCVLCAVHCVLCAVYCVVYCVLYCVLCTVYCVLCTVCCVLCAVCCVLCTMYCVLCTVCCVLCTVYCVLCRVHSVVGALPRLTSVLFAGRYTPHHDPRPPSRFAVSSHFVDQRGRHVRTVQRLVLTVCVFSLLFRRSGFRRVSRCHQVLNRPRITRSAARSTLSRSQCTLYNAHYTIHCTG